MTQNPTVQLADDRGWWFPGGTRGKAHWATADGRSLCGKWAAFGAPAAAFEHDGGERTSPDECVACRRKLDRRRGSQAPSKGQGVQR